MKTQHWNLSRSAQGNLQELQLATNTTPWEAFCQHAKLGMREEFANWLNETNSNAVIDRALEQASKSQYKEILSFDHGFKKLIGKEKDFQTLQKAIEEKPDVLMLVLKYQVLRDIEITSKDRIF